jgi:hypothetical protein
MRRSVFCRYSTSCAGRCVRSDNLSRLPDPRVRQARERPISAFCSTAALTPAARQVA